MSVGASPVDAVAPWSGPDDDPDTTWLLRRERILDRLAPWERRTRVLAAPAGFGKSVVVEQLLGELRAAGDPPTVGRLSLRRHDGPARLALRLSGVVTSLDGDTRAIGRSIDPGSSRLGQRTSRAFAEALVPLGEVVLVIDTTRGPAGGPYGGQLADDLDRLIGDLPPTAQVVVEQRRPWSPDRLQGRDDVLVVGAHDLLLTAEEAAGLVAAASGRALDDGEIVDLMARTGGWPVAVRLAAAAMRGTADPPTALRSIRPSERRIAAFLQDEVVGWQPPPLRSLLQRTSVLDVLTPAACEAVTGDPAAGRFGALLEAEGIATGTEVGPGTVSLHPLLRGFLRAELHEADASAAVALEARAAAWWAAQGQLERAADQLIAAGAWAELLDLADQHGTAVFEGGQAAELLRWLDAVPRASSEWRHEVGLRRALALTMLGETRRAEGILDELGDGSHQHRVAEQLVADTIRSIWVFFDGDPASVLGRADAALAELDRSDPDELPDLLGITRAASLRSLLQGARGRARWYLRDLAGARADLGALVASGDAYPPWRVNAMGTLALVEAWAGNLERAQGLIDRAMLEAGARGLLEHPSTLEVRAASASVHRERGNLDAAAERLDELLTLASRTAPAGDHGHPRRRARALAPRCR